MKYAFQWVKSLIFITQMYIALLPWGIVFAIPAIFSRRAAIFCCRSYCWYNMWVAGWLIGLKCEIRGTPPTDEVLIAAKHQSYLKVGTGVLYKELNQDCVPVATNVGVFWPKRGIYRKPGVAVVDFLPRIPAGLELEPFMAQLEDTVEAKSNALMRDAGFTAIDSSE